jgi:hypothetical protein
MIELDRATLSLSLPPWPHRHTIYASAGHYDFCPGLATFDA